MRFFLTLSIVLNIFLGVLAGYFVGRHGHALEIVPNALLRQETSGEVIPSRDIAASEVVAATDDGKLPSRRDLPPAAPPPLALVPPFPPTGGGSSARTAPSLPPANPVLPPSLVSAPASGSDEAPKPSASVAQTVVSPSDSVAPRVVTQAYHGSSPGNSFLVEGARVALAETYDSEGEEGRSMAIDITPSDESGAEMASISDTLDAAGNSPAQSREGDKPETSPDAPGAESRPLAGEELQANGMTREEELFRMKWGWAAFDAARSAALREARTKDSAAR